MDISPVDERNAGLPDLPRVRPAHELAGQPDADSNGIACTDCHTAHAAKDPVLVKATQPEICFTCHAQQRAESLEYSHHPIREGKVVCTDCHNPHGSPAADHLLKEFTVNETCYNCHADKRGPMLWEHQPVRDNCTELPHAARLEPAAPDAGAGRISSALPAIARQANNSGGAFGGCGSIPYHSQAGQHLLQFGAGEPENSASIATRRCTGRTARAALTSSVDATVRAEGG